MSLFSGYQGFLASLANQAGAPGADPVQAILAGAQGAPLQGLASTPVNLGGIIGPQPAAGPPVSAAGGVPASAPPPAPPPASLPSSALPAAAPGAPSAAALAPQPVAHDPATMMAQAIPHDPSLAGLGSGPASQGNAPAPASPQQAPGLQQPAPLHINPLVAALDNLFLKGSIEKSREEAFQANVMAPYQRDVLMNYARSLPPKELGLFLADPQGYLAAQVKNEELQNLKEGSSLANANGVAVTAPRMGVEPTSGVPYTQTPFGTFASGPSFGGDVTASDGVIYSKRNGQVLGSYSKAAAPGSVPFLPTVVAAPGLAGGTGSDAGGPAPATSATPTPARTIDPKDPRGIRNANWGNVKALPNGQWDGQTGTDPAGYAVFANPEDGIRAASQNLMAKQAKWGLDTVLGIIADKSHGWEPGNIGYARYVASRLGVTPTQKIDLNDPAVINNILASIFQRENGSGPMTRAMGALQSARTGAQPTPGVQSPTSESNGAPSSSAEGRVILQGTQKSDQPLYVLKHGSEVPGGDPNQDYVVNTATGEARVSQRAFNASTMAKRGESFMASDDYKQAANVATAVNGLIGTLKSVGPSTPLSWASLDTAMRAFNPSMGVRQNAITAFMDEVGLPAEFQSEVQKLQGKGFVPQSVAKQLLDAAYAYGESHLGELAAHHKSDVKFATDHGFTENDLGESMPTLAPMPLTGSGPPPVSERVVGRAYETPKGVVIWTGRGWQRGS